jgi:hypothetical protein
MLRKYRNLLKEAIANKDVFPPVIRIAPAKVVKMVPKIQKPVSITQYKEKEFVIHPMYNPLPFNDSALRYQGSSYFGYGAFNNKTYW